MATRKRRLIKANIRYIDPLDCGSTVGYNIITGRRGGVYADIDLTDCTRKITWHFSKNDGNSLLAKIDGAIAMLQEFRTEWYAAAKKHGKIRRWKKAA